MKIISASASALALPLVLAKAENLRGVEATAVADRALAPQLEEFRSVVAKSRQDCAPLASSLFDSSDDADPISWYPYPYPYDDPDPYSWDPLAILANAPADYIKDCETCFDDEGFSFELVIGDMQAASICDRSGGYESGCKAARPRHIKYETCNDWDVIDVTTLAPLGKDECETVSCERTDGDVIDVTTLAPLGIDECETNGGTYMVTREWCEENICYKFKCINGYKDGCITGGGTYTYDDTEKKCTSATADPTASPTASPMASPTASLTTGSPTVY